MAGSPLKRQMIARVADAGGVEVIAERVASGETLAAIADELGCRRENLVRWLYSDEDRATLIREARARAADALVEQTIAIADTASPAEAQLARLRIDTRQWIASRWNRAEYGQDKTPAVQINLGSLHLDALRHVRENRIIDVSPVESTTSPES